MICTTDEYRHALEALKDRAADADRQRQILVHEGLPADQVERALQPTLSFTAGLREDVEAFERMRRGDLGPLHTLTGVGQWLVGARIARGLSRQELADLLGSSEREVERDEQNDYRGISVERAQRILDVLGVRFRAEATCPPADPSTIP
ncbi:MAG: helix-turn-helix transcriptional regulator [Rhodothermales bacterium]